MIPGRRAQNRPDCIPSSSFLVEPHRALATWSLPRRRRGLGCGPKAGDANCFASPLLRAFFLYSRFPLGRRKLKQPKQRPAAIKLHEPSVLKLCLWPGLTFPVLLLPCTPVFRFLRNIPNSNLLCTQPLPLLVKDGFTQTMIYASGSLAKYLSSIPIHSSVTGYR